LIFWQIAILSFQYNGGLIFLYYETGGLWLVEKSEFNPKNIE
jgi:hypothetical protein